MKKIVLFLSALMCTLIVSTTSFAAAIATPIENVPVVSDMGSYLTIPYTIPVSKLNGLALEFWKKFAQVYTSGDSTLTPIIFSQYLDSPYYSFVLIDFSKSHWYGASGYVSYNSGELIDKLVIKLDRNGNFIFFEFSSNQGIYASPPSGINILGYGAPGTGPGFCDGRKYLDRQGKEIKIADDMGIIGSFNHTLTIHYQYEDGSKARESYSSTFADGESFEITSPALNGYRPSLDVISGQMGNADLTYTVTYTQIKHTLTIHYQYEDGLQALQPYTEAFAEGQRFSVPTPSLNGYIPSQSAIAGEMGKADLSYTVTFAKKEEPPSSSESPSDGSSSDGSSSGGGSSGGGDYISSPYIIWDPNIVTGGFRNMSNYAGTAFNTGIWVFLGLVGIYMLVKVVRHLLK